MTISMTDSTTDTTQTVTDYATAIARAARGVGPATLEGEVVRRGTHLTPGGMLFFEITDGKAKLRCKVFSREVRRLDHMPLNGEQVVLDVQRPDVWVEGGTLDLVVSGVRLAGDGQILARREATLARLRAEGLCDPTKWTPLPRFPRTVAIVSGASSSGLADVVKAVSDRFPPTEVIVFPTLVQGVRAPQEIIGRLAELQDNSDIDVIILARGGGSPQDLIAFDDEALCRAVHACDKPVVAAIGHTDNIPVVNHVTWSKETPGRSPELAVPSIVELRQEIAAARQRLEAIPARLEQRVERLGNEARRLNPVERIDKRRSLVSEAASELRLAEQQFFHAREAELAQARSTIAGLPARLPTASAIESLANRVDMAAAAFFAGHQRGIADARRLLDGTPERVKARQVEVTEASRRLSLGMTALADRRVHDLGQGISRRGAEIHKAITVRVDHEAERISALSRDIGRATTSTLDRADAELRIVVSEIRSHDQLGRGFVLVTDQDGRAVRTAASLTPRQNLKLTFVDGQAFAVVKDIHSNSED